MRDKAEWARCYLLMIKHKPLWCLRCHRRFGNGASMH